MTAARGPFLAIVASGALLVLGNPAPLCGQSTPDAGWKIRGGAHLWFATADGEAGLADNSIPVVDTALHVGYATGLEATRGWWSATLELSHNTVSSARPVGSGAGRFDFGFTSVELAAGYRLDRIPSSAAVILRAGGRYVRHRLELPFPAGEARAEAVTKAWVEPFAGLRFATDFGDRVRGRFDATLGGVGLGSDFVWVVDGGFDVRLSARTRLLARYRYFETEYDGGDDGYRWDGRTQGWMFGLGVDL
jgi:hypothetical protein